MSRATLAILALLVAGCTASNAAKSNQIVATDMHGNEHVINLAEAGPAADAAKDPAAPTTTIFEVDVYQLAVPRGTFSSNDEFWKRMDEQCVDPNTYDVLFKNGIRVGEANISELSFFQKFMTVKPFMSKLSTTATDAQKIELEVAKDVTAQTLARFDSANTLTMRDFDQSSNILNLSFEPAPRKPGTVRVKLCPMIRSHRKHYEWTEMNNESPIQYVASEMLYDLNLMADVAQDHFLIVMPSPQARSDMSVGHAFLTRQGTTEPLEQVIVILSKPVASAPMAPG